MSYEHFAAELKYCAGVLGYLRGRARQYETGFREYRLYASLLQITQQAQIKFCLTFNHKPIQNYASFISNNEECKLLNSVLASGETMRFFNCFERIVNIYDAFMN